MELAILDVSIIKNSSNDSQYINLYLLAGKNYTQNLSCLNCFPLQIPLSIAFVPYPGLGAKNKYALAHPTCVSKFGWNQSSSLGEDIILDRSGDLLLLDKNFL